MNPQPIWPPIAASGSVRLPGACTSCRGDVRSDNGFADLDGPPFKAYLCAACVVVALGGNRAPDRVGANQQRFADLHGHYPID